jgi:putative NADH-flavin reductase
MNITVFGATGRTGIPLVQQALDAGHEVVAFVRTPSKMPIRHACLTLVEGDVMNPADVKKAITADTNAVISVLSPVKGSPKNLLPVAVENIFSAMQQHNVKRIVYMTGAGVSMPEDQPKAFDRVMKFLLKTLSGDVLEQSVQAASKIQNSGLEWVILRAPMLTQGTHTGNYRVGWAGVNTGPRLNRADAADFLLKQLTDNQYLRKAPVVSN